jgi:CHAT domain-containing protein
MSGLHELLLGPLERKGHLDGIERLVLVTGGALTYLPFAALVEPGSGRFLIERYELLHAPSAAVFAALRSEPGRAAGEWAGAAFAPQPDSLPASDDEVARFGEVVPGEIFLGRSATEAKFRTALTSGAVVHAAAHAYMNARNPLFSRLRLSPGTGTPDDDGVLHVHEMLDLPVTSPLVFLSACETGSASAWAPGVLGGRDLSTLAQALLASGAHSVVATLWRVEDQSASTLAGHFYDSVRSHFPATALAMAQRQTLADPETAAPFYWAAYQLSGGGW